MRIKLSIACVALVVLSIVGKNAHGTKAINPVLLISFDGLSSVVFEKFLKENPTSNFGSFISQGVKADYMQPSFPSSTFPNHWTLVTGLYPETHGIVANAVYDPVTNLKTSLSTATDIHLWNKSEPIWLSARKQVNEIAVFLLDFNLKTKKNEAISYLFRV